MEDHQTLIEEIDHISYAIDTDGGFSWKHTDLADDIKAACDGA